MEILEGTERILPEIEIQGRVELREEGIKMVVEGIGIGEVDGMRLVSVLCDVGEVETEGLAKTAEFHLALVLQAELECLLGDLLHSTGRVTSWSGRCKFWNVPGKCSQA